MLKNTVNSDRESRKAGTSTSNAGKTRVVQVAWLKRLQHYADLLRLVRDDLEGALVRGEYIDSDLLIKACATMSSIEGYIESVGDIIKPQKIYVKK